MAKGSIGIYISAKYVDIAELGGSLYAPQLTNFIREEIPPEAYPKVQPEEIQLTPPQNHHDNIVAALRKGLSKLKAKPEGVYSVLASSDSIIRYFDIPPLPKSEQAQAIKFEAKKYIPFKIDEIVSDFKTLSMPGPKKTIAVFFMAAAKDKINSQVDIFKRAETEVVGIDIVPYTLMRMLLLGKKIHAKDNVAILYIDNDRKTAGIYIMEMGMPFLSRDLAIPVDDKDALFEKCASELRVSIDYYRSHKLKADITKVIICGDKFFDGLDKFTAEELKIATEAVDTPPGLREGEKLPPSAIVSAGLALGGLGRSNYSVNFSPLAVVIKKKKTVNILFLEAIAAVFIILLVFQVMASKVKTLTSQLNAVIDSGKALPAETEDVDKDTLKNFKENGIEELGFLQFISNSRVPWTAKLDRMTKLIPKGVWLDNLSTKEEFASPGSRYPSRIKRTITITGSAFSSDGSDEMEHINSFYTALKSDKVFMDGIRNIELGSIEKKEFEGYWVSLFVISASSD